MIVTELQPMDNKKVRVYIDSEYAFPLYRSEIRKFGLAVNNDISPDKYEELRDVLFKRIRERILYIISDYDRPKKAIRQKLLDAGYPDEIVDEAIRHSEEYHYIDDRSYACNLAESLANNRHAGKRYIRNKLYEKGISATIIDEVLDEIEIDEASQIESAIRKKGYHIEEIAELDDKEIGKLYAYLCRKGFSSSIIRSIIRK